MPQHVFVMPCSLFFMKKKENMCLTDTAFGLWCDKSLTVVVTRSHRCLVSAHSWVLWFVQSRVSESKRKVRVGGWMEGARQRNCPWIDHSSSLMLMKFGIYISTRLSSWLHSFRVWMFDFAAVWRFALIISLSLDWIKLALLSRMQQYDVCVETTVGWVCRLLSLDLMHRWGKRKEPTGSVGGCHSSCRVNVFAPFSITRNVGGHFFVDCRHTGVLAPEPKQEVAIRASWKCSSSHFTVEPAWRERSFISTSLSQHMNTGKLCLERLTQIGETYFVSLLLT